MAGRRRHHLVLRTKSNVLLTCEHAKGVIPRKYKRLGLTREQLHNSEGDWYDKGAFDLVKAISRNLNTSYLYTDISRLVIDHNRILGSKTLKNDKHHSPLLKTKLLTEKNGVEKSFPIPGNLKNFKKKEKIRYNKYVVPYQRTGEKAVKRLHQDHKLVYMLAIHTLHPLYYGEKRDVYIDVMDHEYRLAKKAGHLMVKTLKKYTNLKVLLNKPWGHDEIGGGGWKYVYRKKNIVHLGVDVNAKNLRTKKDIEKTAYRISRALNAVRKKI